jgi:hypothetical protein
VLTSFSKSVVGDAKPDPEHGRFSLEQGVEKMVTLMGKIERGDKGAGQWGGRVFDWKGEQIPW